MPTYTDIKRYDLDPALLFKIAKQTLVELCWVIKRESGKILVADLPKTTISPGAVFTVTVLYGYIKLYCKTERLSIGNMENVMIVDRFVKFLDQNIAEVSKDQLKSIKESQNLSFK